VSIGIGDQLDRYVIESVLGEGGMGQVFCAFDAKLQRRVALKVLREDRSQDPSASVDAGGRMMREARAVAALTHPNIVAVFDVGELDGNIYIAMELVPGAPVRNFIGAASVPPLEKIRWMLDAARALAAAHASGLVHRDVKPENVLVRGDGVVKVLDFGIAKRLAYDTSAQASDLSSTETATGKLVGTPRYMSPEQVRGEPMDGRSDQFSWAVVTYELVSGTLPWGDSGDPLKLFAALLSVEPPPLSSRVPELPEGVSAVVARAMAKDVGERFPSMAALVTALEAALGFVPTHSSIKNVAAFRAATHAAPTLDATAAPPALPSGARAGSSTRVRRAAVLGVAGVALALSAAVWGPSLGARPAAPAVSIAAPASSTPRSTRLADLPLPTSSNADAVAAFRAGLQAFSDASFEAARQSWDRAVALDGTLGAAHLRLALIDSLVTSDEQDARRAFKNALHFRATLSARDQQILEAFEPYFQRQPPDLAECDRRMAALAAASPDDPELAFYLGYVRFDRGQLANALGPFQRAAELDPGFALARSNVGGVLAYLGRFEESQKALAGCLEASSSATDCLWYRVLIDEQAGACDAEEKELRAWIVKDQEDFYAYHLLAKVLYAQGRPLETVQAALEQKWAKLPEARRKRLEASDRASLAIVKGDFVEAEQRLRELERLLAAEPGALAHAEPARRLVDLYLETGRPKLAAEVADAFVKKLGAWTEPHRVDDAAISDDPQVAMHATLLHTGRETQAAFDAFRDRWVDEWRKKTSDAYVGYLWIYAFALPAESPAEGERAMAARASFPPLPPFLPQTLSLARVGKAYWLAGKAEEARPFLERASRVCLALDEPYLHTDALVLLGSALEQAGEHAGACRAWQSVVTQWGSAKPRSVRAETARGLLAKAGCKGG
jgi:serine/threonine-protein kinase